MSTNLEIKQAKVAEVATVAEHATSMIGADFSGVTVEEMTYFRAEARKADVYIKVIKNNLLKLAVKGTDFEIISESIKGPLIVAFSAEEPGAAARVVRDFCKQNEAMQVRLVVVGGQLLDAGALEAVAKLPTRDEALAKLMGVMKAPVTKLVQTLAAPHSKLVRTFAALKEEKEA
ncbi:MAG: 50S ribosomal protein L10 [Gammaproteobacteria bacterium]|nr:MAG: 50S ribosomal protein L10 [Gammaproteobacteria bacterium]RLA13995.1 MAG: 50S ribosomal protein L10 [Gammaproteobacteria bacterium]